MNQKNYFFLVCLVVSNSQFTMENCDLKVFQDAYSQIKNALETNDVSLLGQPLEFFGHFDDKKIDQSVQDLMNTIPSPLLYCIEAIDRFNVEIHQFFGPEVDLTSLSANESKQYQDVLKKKYQQFQILKLLCSFRLFSSDKWSLQQTTPLISACSSVVEMKNEVELLLAHNADPSQKLNSDVTPYKTALEAASNLNHSFIIELLQANENKDKQPSQSCTNDATTRNFFSTGLTKQKLKKEHEKLVRTIELGDLKTFKEIMTHNWVDVNYLHNDEKNGPMLLVAFALNQYFLQRELCSNIVPNNVNTSQTLKMLVFTGYETAKTILFDILEKKPNLNIDYTHPVINELIRQEGNFSTPLKEAVRCNDRPVIQMLLDNNADITFVGSADEKETPLALAKASKSKDLYNFITKLYADASTIPLDNENDQSIIPLDNQKKKSTIYFDRQYDDQEEEDSE